MSQEKREAALTKQLTSNQFIAQLITNPKDKERLMGAVKELSDSKTRAAAEADLQKDIVEKAADETGVEKAFIKKLGTMYYKQNFNQVSSEFEQLESLYEDLFA
jgi:hypothetical protein